MGKRKLDAPVKLKVKRIKPTGPSQIEKPIDTTPEEFWKSMERRISSSFLKVKIQTLNKIITAIKQGDVILPEPLFRALIIASYSLDHKIPPLIVQCLKHLFKSIEPFHFDKHPNSIQLFRDLIYTLLQTKYLIYFQASYDIFDEITTQEKFEAFTNQLFTEAFIKDITNKYKTALKNTKVIFEFREGKDNGLKLYKIANLTRFVTYILNKTVAMGLSTDPVVELFTKCLNGLYCFILEPSITRDRNTENLIKKVIETINTVFIENKVHNNDFDLICKCITDKIEELNE